jgi:hypothetical protein
VLPYPALKGGASHGRTGEQKTIAHPDRFQEDRVQSDNLDNLQREVSASDMCNLPAEVPKAKELSNRGISFYPSLSPF